MQYTDQLIRTYDSKPFQEAFRAYFAELGVQVTNWDGLFAQMTDDGDPTLLRTDDAGQVIGFIQFTTIHMTSWFFEARPGFVREFWVAPAHRGQGHGTALLAQAEQWFRQQGLGPMILTTDTAEAFYLHRGYRREKDVVARNRAPVYVKALE